MLQGRVAAGCWQMVMGSADMVLPAPADALPPVHEALLAVGGPSGRLSTDAGEQLHVGVWSSVLWLACIVLSLSCWPDCLFARSLLA